MWFEVPDRSTFQSTLRLGGRFNDQKDRKVRKEWNHCFLVMIPQQPWATVIDLRNGTTSLNPWSTWTHGSTRIYPMEGSRLRPILVSLEYQFSLNFSGLCNENLKTRGTSGSEILCLRYQVTRLATKLKLQRGIWDLPGFSPTSPPSP